MYKRKIMDELIAWKNSTGKKKSLVIKGMRQIGKTYIVQAFAKENYENVVYINFKDNESAKKFSMETLLSIELLLIFLLLFLMFILFQEKQLLFLMKYRNVQTLDQV